MKRSIPLLLCGALACAVESDYLGIDTHVSHQLVLSAGLPVGVLRGEVNQPHPIVGTLTQKLDSDWMPGAALGLGWQRTSWNGDGNGWHLELGVSAEQWQGHITRDSIAKVANQTSADVAVQAGLVTLAIGGTWRWDGTDIRLSPRLWQLDVAPVLGLGTARAQVGSGDWSDSGLVWSVGVRARATVALGSGWRIGGQLGAAWSQTTVRWSNTGDSTFAGFGPTAGLVLILGQ